MKSVEIFIRGTVQGVGFRPFIYNLATRFKLSGSVANTGEGVIIRALTADLEAFIKAIRHEAPPLSRIHSLEWQDYFGEIKEGSFEIVKSSGNSSSQASIPPDITICKDCMAELQDPDDPRHAYPFINCTNCGPRFTIVEKIPYDRPYTSMKVFPMCKECMADYEDPSNRRFHAQPNACPVCGPQVSWHDNSGTKIACAAPLQEAAEALGDDKLLAIRGLGGFHLACNALSARAIDHLRTRKNRPHKPLAIMVQSLEVAHKYCIIDKTEGQLLESLEHPIVLLKTREDCPLPENLAPGIIEIGLMLAYTPLHFLLLEQASCPEALVMTSGNASGTPICTANGEAVEKLGQVVDNFLLHDRDIVTRIDDSVTRVTADAPLILRRSRGYVPSPIVTGHDFPPTIGCGAGLKSTFCLAKGGIFFTSQHIGDLTNLETLDFFVESAEHLKKVFQIEPEIAVCDLHPDYMSSHYAKDLDLPLYQVQHHHAHAAAVMVEHELDEDVLAIVLDGTGFGPDGTIWGGEVLRVSLTDYQRLGHLSHLRLPGGDAAATEPWRVAFAAVYDIGQTDNQNGGLELPLALQNIDEDKRQILVAMLANDFNCPVTSSCGRLFDAVSSLLGICQTMSYEGQAAMELEDHAKRALNKDWKNHLLSGPFEPSPFLLDGSDGKWEIDSLEIIRVVIKGIQAGQSPAEISRDFHILIIRTLTALVERLSAQTGLKKVVLSGGCMQNSIILEGLSHTMTLANIETFTGENIPINDGGISLGQTIIGGLQHVSRNSHEGN